MSSEPPQIFPSFISEGDIANVRSGLKAKDQKVPASFRKLGGSLGEGALSLCGPESAVVVLALEYPLRAGFDRSDDVDAALASWTLSTIERSVDHRVAGRPRSTV